MLNLKRILGLALGVVLLGLPAKAATNPALRYTIVDTNGMLLVPTNLALANGLVLQSQLNNLSNLLSVARKAYDLKISNSLAVYSGTNTNAYNQTLLITNNSVYTSNLFVNGEPVATTGSVIRASNYLAAVKMPSNSTLLAWSTLATNLVFPKVYGFSYDGNGFALPLYQDLPTDPKPGTLCYYTQAGSEQLQTPELFSSGWFLVPDGGAIDVVGQGNEGPGASTITVYPFAPGGYVYTNLTNVQADLLAIGLAGTNYANYTAGNASNSAIAQLISSNYVSQSSYDARTNDWVRLGAVASDAGGGSINGALQVGDPAIGLGKLGPQLTTRSWYGAGILFTNSKNDAVDVRNWEIRTDGYTYGDLHFNQGPASGLAPTVPRMVLSLTGNMGIGTNNPSAKLDVVGDAKVNGFINTTGPYTSGGYQVNGHMSMGEVYSTLGIGDISAHYGGFVMYANGGQAALINSSGYFGVGTNNPQSALHVHGDVTVNGAVKPAGSLTTTIQVTVPGGTRTLCFTNGILYQIDNP